MYTKPKRHHVNKGSSAAQFRHNTTRTHAKNMAPTPMRGGFRL